MLEGFQYVILRPRDQAHALCAQIEKEGGKAISLPMIEIVPLTDIPLPDFEKADYLIFVSANAVRAMPVSWWALIRQSGVRIVTMGQATSEAIKNRGAVFFTPPPGSTSETLLATPFLQAPAISCKHVILLAGKTGRQLIAETLIERGASVARVEVYAQRCPTCELDPYFMRWRTEQESIVFIATSVHCLENLIQLTPLMHHNWLYQQPIVVISERMKTHAIAQGFQVIWEAQGASEEAMMKVLVRSTVDLPKRK
jgi:uroporphyrinogen-III synthase